ncbi:cysteine--tRNA ligase [Paramesorhizobium deserti]|uniref:Cysteine--tRNA ligase n=1 Tax=Paramesorhizobium deserti TaxID=1494590 RepID=A0A135HXY9_9HYPH|nr:cysteine--tRNA ligase [Paramesorhizobium deserti]KXF78062.1 cysteine--tRNA ligase [Paramesorhizobium deserti]
MSDNAPHLRLYNTLTHEKEEFLPVDRENVRMYVCGPTVYDYAHIGNARPVIVFDVLFRLLRHLYGEDHVNYARNITDVDDKINARAARDYPDLPLNEAIRKVTETTNAQFQADVAALGCLAPTSQPRATETLDEMRAMIDRLVKRGFAYVADDHVLFSVSSMNGAKGLPRYGALARRSLDEMIAGARVDVASYKRDEMDFVLWKPAKAGEPGWPSPAGIEVPGRPGWHIECSAMSMAKLLQPFGGGLQCDDPEKNVFDIHAGGIDLVFPHHENEIAQSCCALGSDRMANIWMHNGFLQVEGQKMSKSLGNFVTIRELLNDWSGASMRLAMLLTHYRQPINWTLEKLTAARSELADWAACVFDGVLLGEFESRLLTNSRPPIDPRVISPLLDDLNTVGAITGIRALYHEASSNDDTKIHLLNAAHFLGLFSLRNIGALLTNSASGTAPIARFSEHRQLISKVQAASANFDSAAIQQANTTISSQGLVFNIDEADGFVSFDKIDSSSNEPDDIQAKIDERLFYLREKNFAEADRIRSELLEKGIQLKDGKDPATGERVTTWEVKR